MFLHRGMLAPALSPHDYVDPAVYQLEQSAIFAAHWHLVGTAAALERSGDQLAREVLGVPVVVRNWDGELCAYRNVCPHRHSLLVSAGKSSAPTMRCQYHGWSFRKDGRLAQLPDGGSFCGLKARDVCLERLRIERLGPLLFVNLAGQGGTLRDEMGPIHEELGARLADLTLAVAQRSEHAANWKFAVENAVESYHVPMLHPDTFREYLPEEFHEHQLEPTFSRYRPTRPPTPRERLAAAGFRLMLCEPRAERYQHLHVLPNLLISYSGIYVEVAAITPLGVARCLREAYGFLPADVRRNPVSLMLDALHRRLLRRAAGRVLAEDASIWPALHAGASASRYRGVLSAREERVYHFQRYVAARLGRHQLALRSS